MPEQIECVATGSADGRLVVENLPHWAQRSQVDPARAGALIAETAAAMGPDAIPAVNLVTMVDIGPEFEPKWILELDDVSAFVLASRA